MRSPFSELYNKTRFPTATITRVPSRVQKSTTQKAKQEIVINQPGETATSLILLLIPSLSGT